MDTPRKKYIIANWKMNFTTGEASLYLNKLSNRIQPSRKVQIVLAPSTVSLQPLSLQVNRRQFKLAAQNFYWREYGAYTGEVALGQIRGLVDYAIIGHSERRYIFNETNKDLKQKVASAIRNNITPFLCIGETENERNFGETADVIRDQLHGALSEIDVDDVKKVIIAYEPVWAISSNKGAHLAAPDEIATSIKLIRSELKEAYGKEAAEETPILYGGSVNPNNAGAYLTIPGVNGLLIGGASLISDHFIDIIELAKRIRA
jgi:triosephosphate isomerase